jgi:hypothetical protein
MDKALFTIDCTGDVVAGDTILFSETVWPAFRPSGRFGRRSSPKPLGERTVVAEVLRDSYGEKKQQHTFTLKVVACEGYDPIAPGSETTRKGRNVYKNGTRRKAWDDEAARDTAANDKHTRGDAARAARRVRRQEQETASYV